MRKYLSELHKKSDSHKRNFALGVSGAVTLIIFSIWSTVNFGGKGELATKTETPDANEEVSPLESMRFNLGASVGAIRDSFSSLKEGVESIDLDAEYREMRNEALESYE